MEEFKEVKVALAMVATLLDAGYSEEQIQRMFEKERISRMVEYHYARKSGKLDELRAKHNLCPPSNS